MDSSIEMAEPGPVGLRERKAAATRAAIVEALSRRLESRALSDISVDELATAAGISRMTFFNHFATKEHALEHFFVSWLYREQCEARRAGLTGVADVVHLFEAMGRYVAATPNHARQVMAFFAGRPVGRPPAPFVRADRELIAPDLAHEDITYGRHRFPAAVAQARRDGDVTVASSDEELGHMLGVLAFGGAFVGHSDPQRDWLRTYRHNALRALGLDLDWDPRRSSSAKRTEATTRGGPTTRGRATNQSDAKASGTKASKSPRGRARKR